MDEWAEIIGWGRGKRMELAVGHRGLLGEGRITVIVIP